MKEHINILTLLDYAQDKIHNDIEFDLISDHLIDCSFCRKVLRSQFYLIENYDALLEKFFPDVAVEVFNEAAADVADQQVHHPSILFKKLAEKLINFGNQLSGTGKELINDIKILLEGIQRLPGYEDKVVPIIGATLGSEQLEEVRLDIPYLERPDIPVRITLPKNFDLNDFIIELSINSLHVIYDKSNFEQLVNHKLILFSLIWSPYIFETMFTKDSENTYVAASINVKHSDIITIPELFEEKQNFDLFFISIE